MAAVEPSLIARMERRLQLAKSVQESMAFGATRFTAKLKRLARIRRQQVGARLRLDSATERCSSALDYLWSTRTSMTVDGCVSDLQDAVECARQLGVHSMVASSLLASGTLVLSRRSVASTRLEQATAAATAHLDQPERARLLETAKWTAVATALEEFIGAAAESLVDPFEEEAGWAALTRLTNAIVHRKSAQAELSSRLAKLEKSSPAAPHSANAPVVAKLQDAINAAREAVVHAAAVDHAAASLAARLADGALLRLTNEAETAQRELEITHNASGLATTVALLTAAVSQAEQADSSPTAGGTASSSVGRLRPALAAASKQLTQASAILERRDAATKRVQEATRRGREAVVVAMRGGGSNEAVATAISVLRLAVEEAKDARVERDTIMAAQQLLTNVRAKAVAMGIQL